MSAREVLVWVELPSGPQQAGRLWTRARGDRQSATFEYEKSWLDHPERFALEPALSLDPGPFHTVTDAPLFGALGDSAPDRWGRVLMRRAERREAKRQERTPRTLTEVDFLLGVDDETRQGALRFALEPGGPFVATRTGPPIPPLVDLPRLLSAADRVGSDSEDDDDLRLLLAPGSSLGGARPKASVRDRDGSLAIAKFPSERDDLDMVRGEALALTLASRAGIEAPKWRLEDVAGRPVLLLRRFDRHGAVRVPFLSAMSMLGARDRETRSYLEFVDVLRLHGAAVDADMRALWRRIVFNVLISNTDDHLRNHGFLYAGGKGWRLAPAYDLNPVPVDIKPRVLTTAIDFEDTTASLDLAMSVAEHFGHSVATARAAAREVALAVSNWRSAAAALGLSDARIERLSSAFEHDDLRAALAASGGSH